MRREYPPLELRVNPEDAKSKIQERVTKGVEIRQKRISSEESLESSKKLYYKWNDFNKELLKRIFSTDELAEEYSGYAAGAFVRMTPPPLERKIIDFHRDVDGKIHKLDSIIERVELIPASFAVEKASSQTVLKDHDRMAIFIVHGHDTSAKFEVARFIEKMGFKPIILHEQTSGSKTIIEKIEAYSNVGFGVVIYTPCDIGAKNDDAPDFQGRARQNVVFEHGFLMGKLGRENVCSLVNGEIETPNDVSGIVYTSMDSGNWQVELAKELRASGYQVDMNKVL